jgi:signal transduction histidine kinase
MPTRILLIHGDKESAEALKTYPWHSQYDVTFVHHDRKAYGLLEEDAWDIVAADPFISDEMPKALLGFKTRCPRTQIVIFSSEKKLDAAMDFFSSSVADYLSMPLNPRVLEFSFTRAVKTISLNQKINRYSERIAQLHNAQDLLSQLFEEVPCFISVQDKDLKVTAANKLFKTHFGKPFSGYCYEIYKHRDTPCPDCPVAATFADGKSHTTEEVVTSKFGKQYNVLTQTAPIKNEIGQITQVMEMSTDITQIRQLQDHLISLGLMLGSMSHGVKGMLTALDGGIYQLETGIVQKDDARVGKAFGQIQQMADKIKKMVLEILYYAKSRDLNYERKDIAEFAKSVVDTVKPMAQKNDIKLSVSIPETLGKIEVDSNWMEAALVNFLENALDACLLDEKKKNHWIRFSVKKQSPGFILFTIEDNGTGMDEETENKMFTLFFSSKGSQGTGLGLFIAHRVVKYHGGLIEVSSRKGEGSRFDICLPFEKPENTDNFEE